MAAGHAGIDELRAGREIAATSDFEFRVPAYQPYNPAYEPSAVEAAMLDGLKASGDPTHWLMDDEARTPALHAGYEQDLAEAASEQAASASSR